MKFRAIRIFAMVGSTASAMPPPMSRHCPSNVSRAMYVPVLPTPAEQCTKVGTDVSVTDDTMAFRNPRSSAVVSGTPWSGHEVYEN